MFVDHRLVQTFQSLILIVLVPTVMAFAQKGRGDEPVSDELHKAITARIDAIERESNSDRVNEWAGTYFDGDHHATVIHWAPQGGFVVAASHHTFFPSWVNYGQAKYENGRFALFPELKKGQPNAYGIGSEFVPVRWDKWHIRVPSDQLLQFAYAVHSNSESEIWNYSVKAGDSEKSRKGLPKLPIEYLKFMKMPAVQARIIEVKKSNSGDLWSSEVVLDVGTKQNVIEGMKSTFSVGPAVMWGYASTGSSKRGRMRISR